MAKVVIIFDDEKTEEYKVSNKIAKLVDNYITDMFENESELDSSDEFNDIEEVSDSLEIQTDQSDSDTITEKEELEISFDKNSKPSHFKIKENSKKERTHD